MKRVYLLWVGLVSGVSFVWYPHALIRTTALGYDFPIYYLAGKGLDVMGWMYADHIKLCFYWCRLLDYNQAFAIFYVVSMVCFLFLTYRLFKLGWLGIVFSVLALYPYLLTQDLGNVGIILAVLVLNPWGALCAMSCKPYLVLFVLFHALLGGYRIPGLLHFEKAKSDLPNSAVSHTP
jgi:hypothetical protein